jgi:carbonic anhydrase
MRYILLTLFILFHPLGAEGSQAVEKRVLGLLRSIFRSNDEFVHKSTKADFKVYRTKQQPRATVVMCCDSRVQTIAFGKTPKNDLFIVRNIGNQLHSNRGSVEYGIRRIHTPVLLIIGHVDCGAVKAAQGDYSTECEPIRQELDSLHVDKKAPLERAVIDNVHTQVADALKDYADLIAEEKLFVFGAVYDFRNDFKQGHGRLILVNYNGEKDPNVIKRDFRLAGIEDVKIGP